MNFENEPPHSNYLIAHGKHPWNAEPPLTTLLEYPITPESLVYCRNHCPVKAVSAERFTLKVDGLVERNLEFTLADLHRYFPKIEVVAALQCAGNRRKAMQDKKHKQVEGVLWGEGTICNVRWGGVRLRDLLSEARVLKQQEMMNLHVCFASPVSACEDVDWYGASIPIEKAMDPYGDVLLACEMNGKPLSPDHGHPFRIVIPGYSGARWVKWVNRITVTEHESENYYQQRDYKVLPPHVNTHEMADSGNWWSKVPAIQVNALNSAIGKAEVQGSTLYVKGYAVGGATAQVRKVEVSINDGHSWVPTTITYQEGRWSWTLWEASIPLLANVRHGTVYSRAVDERGNVQPSDVDWNLRGVAYSAFGEKLF